MHSSRLSRVDKAGGCPGRSVPAEKDKSGLSGMRKHTGGYVGQSVSVKRDKSGLSGNRVQAMRQSEPVERDKCGLSGFRVLGKGERHKSTSQGTSELAPDRSTRYDRRCSSELDRRDLLRAVTWMSPWPFLFLLLRSPQLLEVCSMIALFLRSPQLLWRRVEGGGGKGREKGGPGLISRVQYDKWPCELN